MYCQLDSAGRCRFCGAHRTGPVVCGGGEPAPKPKPSRVRMAVRYGVALARWTAAGQPARNQAEIDALLAVCRGCEWYGVEPAPHCRKCGCHVNAQAEGWRNKLAMLTEHCPLGKW